MSAHKKSNNVKYMIIINTNIRDSALTADVICMKHIRHLKKKKWYSYIVLIKKINRIKFKTIKKNNLIHGMSVNMPVFKITIPNSNYRVYHPNALILDSLKGN